MSDVDFDQLLNRERSRCADEFERYLLRRADNHIIGLDADALSIWIRERFAEIRNRIAALKI